MFLTNARALGTALETLRNDAARSVMGLHAEYVTSTVTPGLIARI